jgi:PEP-CTERM motif
MHHAIKVTLLSLAVSFLGATSAKANQFFDLSYSGEGVSVVGVLEANQPSADPYEWLAVGITGTRNNGSADQVISALLAPGTFGSNDNLFYIGAFPQLNVLGISYVVDGNSFNILYLSSTASYQECSVDCLSVQPLTITLRETPVPVPATLALFGLGLLGLGLTRAKRAL